MDGHNYSSIAVTVVLFGLGIVGFLLRSWVSHVNSSLSDIWKKLDDDRTSREERWAKLHQACTSHGERIAKLEGKICVKNSKG